MAKRKPPKSSGPTLFEPQIVRLERQIRRQRALFIPRLLQHAARNFQLEGPQQDRAFEIACQWASLEKSGNLYGYKETTVDTQFLDQLFGEGLGYAVKTTSPERWQLEHKFPVPGVGTADAALGHFDRSPLPSVMVELKGARTDLDRDRSNGRTAVQQCWDYLNAVPSCPWGIVSNFRTIRLYHRDKGILSYEEFSLQELTERKRFDDFYFLFERDGLLTSRASQKPRALQLLELTQNRQREVGDDLYRSYQDQRLRLIEHLKLKHGKPLDTSIRIAQKLLDRVIFIAFCEDRGLLAEKCLERTISTLPPFTRIFNPRWQGFLALFDQVDRGGEEVGVLDGYNGNLFKPDDEIETLDLEDIPWTKGFSSIGEFDFSEEVNVEVLGHLFERSVTELEKLRVGGLFALQSAIEPTPDPVPTARRRRTDKRKPPVEAAASKMPKSAQRKRFGIYYTPPAFTGLIVERTVEAVALERFAALQKKHKVDPESREEQDPKRLAAYWNGCLKALQELTVCDPACGSGAFLIRAYDSLEALYQSVIHGLAGTGISAEELTELEDEVPDWILNRNLFGVDLSSEAIEITQLALWIRSARKNRQLSDLSRHIVCGNSLVSDQSVDLKALDWQATFPAIFGPKGAGGFTCVIGNPPWERMKLEEREFFALGDSQIATAPNAADRKKLIAALEAENPELWDQYRAAQASATKTLNYVRSENAKFPLTGRGDVNLYMLFAELATRIVAPDGRVGLLLPSGIATDHTTQEFFNELVTTNRLTAIYDFVNRLGLFPDVEGRLKFCVLLFGGETQKSDAVDFVFWAERMEDIAIKGRHVALSERDIQLLNPNTRTSPIFRTQRDATLTKQIYKRVPILVDENRNQGGNPWGIKFLRMFDQTNDAGLFGEAKTWHKKGYVLDGNRYVKKKKQALPLLEAKMTREYDHRASWVTMNPKNAYMNYTAESVSLVEHQNPEFLPKGRYWVAEEDVAERAPKSLSVAAIGFHDVARANDTRTMVPCFVPYAAYSNTLPLVINDADVEWRRFSCLAANFNAYVFDFVVRQKQGGAHLNFFIVEQLPTLPPDAYADKCPWAKRETLEHWISERVLKLSCTADDMIPLAKACDFKGSRGDGVHIWKEEERAKLRAELDAAYFHLYGIARDDVEYILSTFTNTGVLPEEERQGTLFRRGSVGEHVLEEYDKLVDR